MDTISIEVESKRYPQGVYLTKLEGHSMKTGRGGVKYEDLQVGDGELASKGSEVEIRYDLKLNGGEKIQEQVVVTFRIGERSVIAGVEYGVEGMREGGVRRVRVGPHLAYRSEGVPGIVPHDAVLEFQIELLQVFPPR